MKNDGVEGFRVAKLISELYSLIHPHPNGTTGDMNIIIWFPSIFFFKSDAPLKNAIKYTSVIQS